MTNSKISIRPIISTIQSTSATEIESFQNETLRPIIKLQHSILIALFQNSISKSKGTFNDLKDPAKKEFITNEIRKNIPLRNQIIGLVFGLCTKEEFEHYTELRPDVDKRIINMCIERLQNSLGELIH